MDTDAAADILRHLLAGYPLIDLDDLALDAWVEAIQDTKADPVQALEIARRWSRTHERFPSLADFLAVITPRTYTQPVDDPDELRLNPDASRRLVRMWRGSLATVSKRVAEIGVRRGAGGHWHGGPNPCPLCDGKPPPGPIR